MISPEDTPASTSALGSPTAPGEIPFEIPSGGHASPWKVALIVGIIVLATLGYGWGTGWFAKPASSSYACSGELNLTGSGTALPASILSAWSSGFRHYSGCFNVSYLTPGASAGVSQLGSRTVYFAVTDAPLNASASPDFPTPSSLCPWR